MRSTVAGRAPGRPRVPGVVKVSVLVAVLLTLPVALVRSADQPSTDQPTTDRPTTDRRAPVGPVVPRR